MSFYLLIRPLVAITKLTLKIKALFDCIGCPITVFFALAFRDTRQTNAKGEYLLTSFLFVRFALYTAHGHRDRKSNRGAFRHSGCFCFFERSVVSVQVIVRDNNVDQALKALKKKMQREGIFREMKLRRHFEKPSEKKAREGAEAIRRARKLERKRIEREGF